MPKATHQAESRLSPGTALLLGEGLACHWEWLRAVRSAQRDVQNSPAPLRSGRSPGPAIPTGSDCIHRVPSTVRTAVRRAVGSEAIAITPTPNANPFRPL